MHDLGYRLLEYIVGLTFVALVLQNLLVDRLDTWAIRVRERHGM